MTKNQQKKVFLTGATGLLGSHIAKSLIDEGYFVIAIHRKPNSYGLCQSFYQKIHWIEGTLEDNYVLENAMEGVDAVIHSAGLVSFEPNDKDKLMKINAEGTKKVVDIALYKGVLRFIHISSTAALGRSIQNLNPISELTQWTNNPLNSKYAISKRAAELEVWRGIQEGLSAVILNPAVIIGEGDWNASSTKLFKQVANGLKFYPVGSNGYVDVRDIARFCVLMLNSNIQSERFILSENTYSYQNMFEKIAKGLGVSTPKIRFGPLLAGMAWRYFAIKRFLTGSKSLITKETAATSGHLVSYDNRKSKSIEGFQYTPMDDSIARITKAYLKEHK
jgi:dihydroflavonol-4-reductase